MHHTTTTRKQHKVSRGIYLIIFIFLFIALIFSDYFIYNNHKKKFMEFIKPISSPMMKSMQGTPRSTFLNDTPQNMDNPTPRIIFIDFGANCGNSFKHFTKYILEKNNLKFTEVHLFEPQPQVFNQWLVPLSASTDHIHVYNAAISDKNMNVSFFIDSLYPSSICTMDKGYPHGASSLHSEVSGPNFKEVSIPSIDAAEFFQNLKLKDLDFVLMKIDIESHEYIVLRHMITKNVLCKYVDELWVEWHDPPKISNIMLSKNNLQGALEWILTECVSSYHEWIL